MVTFKIVMTALLILLAAIIAVDQHYSRKLIKAYKEELIQTAELMESIAQGLELNDPDLTKRSVEVLRDTAEMIKLGEEMKE